MSLPGRDWSVAHWVGVFFFLCVDSAVSQHVRKPFSLLSSKSLMQQGSNKKNLLVNKTAPWKTLKTTPSVSLSLEFKQDYHYCLLFLKRIPNSTLIYQLREKEFACSWLLTDNFFKEDNLESVMRSQLGALVICSNTTHFIWANTNLLKCVSLRAFFKTLIYEVKRSIRSMMSASLNHLSHSKNCTMWGRPSHFLRTVGLWWVNQVLLLETLQL